MYHRLVYEVLGDESAVGLGVLLNERNVIEGQEASDLMRKGYESDCRRWKPVSPISFANGKYQVVIALA